MREDVFIRQMRSLNNHLTPSKKTLKSLLEEDDPHVILKDGSEHHIDRSELKLISELIQPELYNKLRLPLFIELSSGKYGSGTARIIGDAECELISAILDEKKKGDEMFIHRQEIRKIRKKLKTTTQHLFTISLD